jgi:hypothetical protein
MVNVFVKPKNSTHLCALTMRRPYVMAYTAICNGLLALTMTQPYVMVYFKLTHSYVH